MIRFLGLLLFLIFSLSHPSTHARPPQENDLFKKRVSEQDIFVKTIYPFLRKNCVECHGEQAFYPVGPSHSHSNPKNAFQVFYRLLDLNNLQNSRFIKIANNKHFCREHRYNCENQDQVIADLNKLFTDYATQLSRIRPKSKSENEWLIDNKQMVFNKDLRIHDEILTLQVIAKPYQSDFIKIVSISLGSKKNLHLSFDGIEVRVNGSLPSKATGLENQYRDLLFEGSDLMKTKLSLLREPILKAKIGDRLNVQLTNLRTVQHQKTKMCENKEKAYQIYKDVRENQRLSTNIYGRSDAFMNKSALQICHQVSLMIDSQRPSQSVIVQQAPKADQAGMLTMVQTWLRPIEKVAKLPKISLFTVGGTTTCYLTVENNFQCFGYTYYGESEPPFPTTSPLLVNYEVENIFIGFNIYAIKTKDGKIIFSKDSSYNKSLPASYLANTEYTFPTRIKDFQFGDGLSCYLDDQNDIYCGGKSSYKAMETYEKLIPNEKFKSMVIAGSTVLALSASGELYYYAKDYNTYGFNLTNNIEKLDISFKAKSLIRGAMDFCLESEDQKFYCYGYNNFGQFGASFKRGDELSLEGHVFKKIFLTSTAIYGISEDKALYAKGLYMTGMINLDKENTSRTFKKIQNVPSQYSQVVMHDSAMCFLNSQNQIACFGDQIAAGINASVFRDFRGRALYNGEDAHKMMLYQTPHIIKPLNVELN